MWRWHQPLHALRLRPGYRLTQEWDYGRADAAAGLDDAHDGRLISLTSSRKKVLPSVDVDVPRLSSQESLIDVPFPQEHFLILPSKG